MFAWLDKMKAQRQKNRALADEIHQQTGSMVINPMVVHQYQQSLVEVNKTELADKYKYIGAVIVGAFLALK